jgi:hypothetical protein
MVRWMWYDSSIGDAMDEMDKITIIEGPTPTFEEVNGGWVWGLNESPLMYDLALTRLRTFNGAALVERCHHAWRHNEPIFLHYRSDIGLEDRAPILAARNLDTPEGQVLLLWVRRNVEESQPESDSDDDGDGGVLPS